MSLVQKGQNGYEDGRWVAHVVFLPLIYEKGHKERLVE